MRVLAVLVGLGALGVVAALAAIFLGLPDVAATTPHWKLTEWVVSTTMENAVRRRAAGSQVPDDLDAPARIRAGAAAYDHMCAMCHEAPGVDVAELAEGLMPEPPELDDEMEEWSAAELFWITKHGVRMTGMPAFGPTHSDGEIWDVVAFLQVLPDTSPAEYRALVAGGEGAEPHEHDHEGHDH